MTRETECLGRGKQSAVNLQQVPPLPQCSYRELSRYKTVTVTLFLSFSFYYLLTCMCAHVCRCPQKQRGDVTPLELELQSWDTWHAGNGTLISARAVCSQSPSHLSSSYFSFSLNSNCFFFIEYKCKNIKEYTHSNKANRWLCEWLLFSTIRLPFLSWQKQRTIINDFKLWNEQQLTRNKRQTVLSS